MCNGYESENIAKDTTESSNPELLFITLTGIHTAIPPIALGVTSICIDVDGGSHFGREKHFVLGIGLSHSLENLRACWIAIERDVVTENRSKESDS